jgi:hypothetical protein
MAKPRIRIRNWIQTKPYVSMSDHFVRFFLIQFKISDTELNLFFILTGFENEKYDLI